MTKKQFFHILAPLAVASALCGCSDASVEKRPAPEILMQVGDSVLTRDMVTTLIPSGLSAADSIRMFDAIVESWVERNMLVNLAGSQLPDIEKIENMVQRYREQLLANEYRKVMAADNVHGVSAQSVQEYYDEHPDMYRLARPLVKGIYLKVAGRLTSPGRAAGLDTRGLGRRHRQPRELRPARSHGVRLFRRHLD